MRNHPAFAIAVASLVWANAATAAGQIASVTYKCADNKTIDAAYYSDKVEIKLSDGRDVILPHSKSGFGIRYANADGSVVFWSKGDDAFVTEGDPDKPTYIDCVDEKK